MADAYMQLWGIYAMAYAVSTLVLAITAVLLFRWRQVAERRREFARRDALAREINTDKPWEKDVTAVRELMTTTRRTNFFSVRGSPKSLCCIVSWSELGAVVRRYKCRVVSQAMREFMIFRVWVLSLLIPEVEEVRAVTVDAIAQRVVITHLDASVVQDGYLHAASPSDRAWIEWVTAQVRGGGGIV